jgi:hypothetical protein
MVGTLARIRPSGSVMVGAVERDVEVRPDQHALAAYVTPTRDMMASSFERNLGQTGSERLADEGRSGR